MPQSRINNTEKTTLRDYIRVIFRHKAVIIVTFITVIITALIGLELRTPVYEATVKVLISAVGRITSPYYREPGFSIGTEKAITEGEIVKSRPVIERAIKNLRLDQRPLDYEKRFASKLKAALIDFELKKLKAKVEAMTPEQKQTFLFRRVVKNLKTNLNVNRIRRTDIFTISVKDFDPEEAAKIANVISRSYVIFDLEQQLTEFQLKYGEKHSLTMQLQEYIERMQKNLDGNPVSNIEALGPASVKIIEQATIPFASLETSRILVIIFAFLSSGALGILLAFGFDYLDQTFKSPQDVEKFLNIPFLGSIPKKKFRDKQIIDIKRKRISDYTRSYQNLSDQMYLLMRDRNLRSVLVTDAEASKDISAIIANISIYLAQKAGFRVLIVDANLRSPSISNAFNISNNLGLTDVLEGKIPFEDTVQDLGFSLYVLPAGKTVFNPLTLLGSSIMSDVITKAKEQYEIIFINCADLRNFTDAAILSSIVDGVVLMVNESKVERQVVKTAIAPLEEKNVNIVGVILNNHSYVIPKIIYRLT